MASKAMGLISYYYAGEFWHDLPADPFTATFAWVETPWPFLLTALTMVVMAKLAASTLKSLNIHIDLRAAYIVLSGLAFGPYTVGLAIVYFISNRFADAFDCDSYDPDTTNLPSLILKGIGYILLCLRVYEFTFTVLAILSGHRVGLRSILYRFIPLLVAWACIKINPGGVIMFPVVLDLPYKSLVYGFVIMLAASSEVRPDRIKSKKFLSWLVWFRVVTLSLTLVHQVYFLLDDRCLRTPKELLVLTSIHSLMTLLLEPVDQTVWIIYKVTRLSSTPIKTGPPVISNNNVYE